MGDPKSTPFSPVTSAQAIEWLEVETARMRRDFAEFLATGNRSSDPKNLPEFVVQAVCDHYGLHPAVIRSGIRIREHVMARAVICYILRRNSAKSLVAIAQLVGLQDHATTRYGIEKVRKLLLADDRGAVGAVRAIEDKISSLGF